jgi:hypothetical protein
MIFHTQIPLWKDDELLYLLIIYEDLFDDANLGFYDPFCISAELLNHYN